MSWKTRIYLCGYLELLVESTYEGKGQGQNDGENWHMRTRTLVKLNMD